MAQSIPYKDANGRLDYFQLNTAPTFTSGTTAYFTQGTPGTSLITASGAPLPSINAADLPAGFTTLTNPAAGTAQLNYDGTTVAGNYSGPLSAFGGSFDEETWSIIVNPPPPQFTSPTTAPFTKGVPGSFTVQVTGLSGSGDYLGHTPFSAELVSTSRTTGTARQPSAARSRSTRRAAAALPAISPDS